MTSQASAQAAGNTWPRLINALINGTDLTAGNTEWAMNSIMSGEATPAQVAGFLVALRSKGETVDELVGLVEAMIANASPIEIAGQKLDIVGTGGDQQNTVNISTMAALIAAGAGAKVVKHGNRAASSTSGSADVLEALGVRLDLPIPRVALNAEEAGITFCFAQVFHPSMRHAAVARRELGVPTAFNFLGPMINPAHVQASAVGVANERMAPLVAGVLAKRGSRGLVFRGNDGLDELTTTGPSRVWEIRNGAVSEEMFDPRDLGIRRATLEELRGGDAAANAAVVRSVLAGAPRSRARCGPAERRGRARGLRPGCRRPVQRADGRGVEAGGRVHRIGCGRGRPGPLGRPALPQLRFTTLTGDCRARLIGRRYRRRPRRVALLFEAEGEGRVQVVLGVGAEGDLRGGVDDAGNLGELVRDDVRQILVLRDPGDGNEIPFAGDGIDLADALDGGDLLRGLRDAGSVCLNQDESGDHV